MLARAKLEAHVSCLPGEANAYVANGRDVDFAGASRSVPAHHGWTTRTVAGGSDRLKTSSRYGKGRQSDGEQLTVASVVVGRTLPRLARYAENFPSVGRR